MICWDICIPTERWSCSHVLTRRLLALLQMWCARGLCIHIIYSMSRYLQLLNTYLYVYTLLQLDTAIYKTHSWILCILVVRSQSWCILNMATPSHSLAWICRQYLHIDCPRTIACYVRKYDDCSCVFCTLQTRDVMSRAYKYDGWRDVEATICLSVTRAICGATLGIEVCVYSIIFRLQLSASS